MAVNPANVPTSEQGRASNAMSWWAAAAEEPTPELRWPQSVDVFDRMRRQDAQVASVLRAVTMPVRRTGWRLRAGDARPEVVALVAEDLGLEVVGEENGPRPLRTRDRFSFADHLRLALLMLPLGHSFFEQVYRIDDAGFARLRKLAHRPSRTIAGVDVADDGGLVAIHQYGPDGDIAIPVSRLVAYVHDREGANWLGHSILRPAYKHWLLKDRLLRTQNEAIDRNGMGVPIYIASEDEEGTEKGLKIATSLRAGATAGAAIPNGASLRLAGVEGQRVDADPAIRYHDEQIARAVLAHFLNLGTQTGSWALGSTFADFFTMSLQAVAEQVRDVVQQHVIEDLVDVNYGEQEPAPLLVFDEIGSQQDAVVYALKALVDSGVILPDSILEEFVRQMLHLPAKQPKPPATGGTSNGGGTA